MSINKSPIVTDFREWLRTQPVQKTSSTLLYDDMHSQSGESLSVIYQPFDARKRGHWHDAGLIEDFLVTTGCRGGKVLDFGPGDGWPSLALAPFVQEVIGVDASSLRVAVCQENANRLGIGNARFVHYLAGERLPFRDEEFDAVVAASSLEQCPDIPGILSELHRVLKPGGRLRMAYESLSAYEGKKEIEIWLREGLDSFTGLLIYLRDIPNEKVEHVNLRLTLPYAAAVKLLGGDAEAITLERILASKEALQPYLAGICTYTLTHPGGESWIALLKEAGFSTAQGTHNAGKLAVQLMQSLPSDEMGAVSLAQAQAAIAQTAPFVSFLPAPIDEHPMILAVK
ncbi:hypothetical protein BVG16_28945 [Paenibacillus selenitireducens]|uniref:Methyltransferase type 11 domain-containing protein n=1 Tax=Paenibacillus selenitireducens TaxID=1324314 RepID=A0A1T2X0F1_9BACL|nr:class I SAM-dependent methyltransferase [Paenibacillus selenitireducens]OPA73364.1 hypothetical protein BVG16_28945 [Paenibacillus selenitireducens]